MMLIMTMAVMVVVVVAAVAAEVAELFVVGMTRSRSPTRREIGRRRTCAARIKMPANVMPMMTRRQ